MKKKIIFLTLFIILLILISCFYIVQGNYEGTLNFTYKGINYSINIEQIAQEKNINLNNYPYYIISEDNQSNLSICYSDKRLSTRYSDGIYYIMGSSSSFRIIIQDNGMLLSNYFDMNSIGIEIQESDFQDKCIASNQDIYYNSTKIFSRNHGNEYDAINETEKICHDVVKVNKDTTVYESAAMNYNEIVTLETGNIVTRINSAINETNGHIWDKVKLSNGIEGYVFSDNLEIIEEEYANIEFEYNNKICNIYFLYSNYEINLDNYPYYIIAEDNQSKLTICYSPTRLTARKLDGNYYIMGGDSSIKIVVNYDGTISIKTNINMNWSQDQIEISESEFQNKCIASSQDIYYNGIKIFNRNHGYEYDATNENEKAREDITKIVSKTVVYESAAMNYNEIATLEVGSIVKRTHNKVNEVNGHIWDKIELSNGTVGYVFSYNLELILEEDYTHVAFEYSNKSYNIYFNSSNYNIYLDNYPYYVIAENNQSKLTICYSPTRLTTRKLDGIYYIMGGDSSIKIVVNYDGTISIKTNINMNWSQNQIEISEGEFQNKCIASSQDIYYNGIKIFNRNHGYEYDATNENEKAREDITKIVSKTVVYESAAMNYNEIATLEVGSIIKRTHNEVNEANGHVWDKIKLNDGTEGYIFSSNSELAIESEYTHLAFNHKDLGLVDTTYDVYFPTINYNINLNDYPYYVIALDNHSKKVTICYSQTKLTARKLDGIYYIMGGVSSIKIVVNYDGTISIKTNINMNLSSEQIETDDYIASNQDIYDNNTKVFSLCVYDETGKVPFTVDRSWDAIASTDDVYSAIKLGEEQYNSMSIEERIILIGDLEIFRQTLIPLVKTVYYKYENGSQALLYFLTSGVEGKTGYEYLYEDNIYKTNHTMRRISLETAINENITMQEKLEDNIKTVMNIAEKINISEDSTITFCNSIEDSGATKQNSNMDWFITLGKYRIKMQCTVTRIGDDYQLEMKYGLIDYYDWESTSNEGYRELFDGVESFVLDALPQYLQSMHKAGISRNYTNYGEIFYTITWNATERATTGLYEKQIKNN